MSRCDARTVEGSRCRADGTPGPDGHAWCHRHNPARPQPAQTRAARDEKASARRKALRALPAQLTALIADLREDDLCDCCNLFGARLEALIREVEGERS